MAILQTPRRLLLDCEGGQHLRVPAFDLSLDEQGGFVEHETPCMAKPPGATTPSVKCVRDATSGRLDLGSVPGEARGICAQPNHEWAHACWHLRKSFERAGFSCEAVS